MEKKRIHWIDVAKGILILLLLIHHFTTATLINGIDLSQYSFMTLWTILFTSFFMQAFFFLSGYCTSFEKPASTFYYGIFKQLVVPFICFEYFICVFYSKSFLLTDIYSCWVESGGTHLWFLNALIVSKVFIWFFIKCYRSRIALLLTSFLVLVCAVFLKQNVMGGGFMCLLPSLGSIFYVALGYVCKDEDRFQMLRKTGVIFPYFLILLLLFHITIPTFMGSMRVTIKSLPILLVLSITGTMELINLCKRIQHNMFFEFWGRNTLLVYGLHFIPLVLYLGLLYNMIHPVDLYEKILLVVLVYILEITTLFLLISLFKYKPFRWILGKL